MGQDDGDGWTLVTRRTKGSSSSINNIVNESCNYSDVHNNNNPIFPAPDPSETTNDARKETATTRRFTMSEILTTKEDKQERIRQQQKHRLATFRRLAQQEDLFLDECITTAKDERTVLAKTDCDNKYVDSMS